MAYTSIPLKCPKERTADVEHNARSMCVATMGGFTSSIN